VNLIAKLGVTTLNTVSEIGKAFFLFIEILYFSILRFFKKGIRIRETFIQMYKAGLCSVPVSSVISFAVGAILAMQTAYQLKKFGAINFVADLVAVAITRELGPLLTAILIASRVGSSITAEIGTMKVAEELDALKTTAINPTRFLAVPRFISLLIMLPALTVLSDILGILGGMAITTSLLDVHPATYYIRSLNALLLKDFVTGLIKSAVFAGIIVVVSCHKGFNVKKGGEGVGIATTQAVVTSIFLIILTDCFFTVLFYFI